MLTFTLTGVVGSIVTTPHQTHLAVSSERSLPCGGCASEWVQCLVREPELCAKIGAALHRGAIVRIEGEIEPRRRAINGLGFYDVVFVARLFEKLTALPTSSFASGDGSQS